MSRIEARRSSRTDWTGQSTHPGMVAVLVDHLLMIVLCEGESSGTAVKYLTEASHGELSRTSADHVQRWILGRPSGRFRRVRGHPATERWIICCGQRSIRNGFHQWLFSARQDSGVRNLAVSLRSKLTACEIVKKTFRCPVVNQVQEKGIENEVREYTRLHQGEPGITDWVNERDRCDQQAEFVKFVCEEFAIPNGTTLDQMPRTGKGHIRPIALGRNFIVRCPIHGEQFYQEFGHHVSVKK